MLWAPAGETLPIADNTSDEHPSSSAFVRFVQPAIEIPPRNADSVAVSMWNEVAGWQPTANKRSAGWLAQRRNVAPCLVAFVTGSY
jgi:hypothetical protein